MSSPGSRRNSLSAEDHRLLDEIQRASCLFFWEAAHPETGMVKDRSRADGPDERIVSSIAATGFGLTALCVADRRGYRSSREIKRRVITTLEYLQSSLSNERGFFYHFINWETGERVWNCELSSIDTGLLLCGVLTCRQYFSDRQIRKLATAIYKRMDWRWMMAGSPYLCHGWKPESGFLKHFWNSYCEHMLIYLLAMGSPTFPIPAEAWDAWRRPTLDYGGMEFISGKDPLFTHQYSHAWFDFRGRRDGYADYFENSIRATRAHKQFCLSLRDRFPHYSEDLWGITASDSAKGYVVWGGPPEHGPVDGTVVPCAAGGSLPFLQEETLRVLRHIKSEFGQTVWKRYGFADAFNPMTSWVAPDVIGIDVGILLLMAENARSELVWNTFMKNPEAKEGMRRAEFRMS